MAIGTRYRLSVVGRYFGTLHANTWWFLQVGDPPTFVPSQHLINLFTAQVLPFYRTLFPTQMVLSEMNVWISKGSPENLSTSINVNGNQLLGGVALPTQCSSVVTWTTGIAGRRFRGRSYFGALTSGAVNGQQVVALYLDRVTQVAQRLVETMDDDGVFNFVVWSKVNQSTSKVTGWTLRTGIFTQRKRTAAYGE